MSTETEYTRSNSSTSAVTSKSVFRLIPQSDLGAVVTPSLAFHANIAAVKDLYQSRDWGEVESFLIGRDKVSTALLSVFTKLREAFGEHPVYLAVPGFLDPGEKPMLWAYVVLPEEYQGARERFHALRQSDWFRGVQDTVGEDFSVNYRYVGSV